MSSPVQTTSSSLETHRAAQLGFVAQILFNTPRKAYRIATLSVWVWPAILLEQIEVFFNERGAPVGYATWAHLSDETAGDLVREDRVLHLSEWNEGLNLWIIDIVAPAGDAGVIALKLRSGRFAGAQRARAVRRDADGRIRRIVDLRRRRIEPHGN